MKKKLSAEQIGQLVVHLAAALAANPVIEHSGPSVGILAGKGSDSLMEDWEVDLKQRVNQDESLPTYASIKGKVFLLESLIDELGS